MGYTHGIKWTYELVNEYIEKLKYKLISKEYLNYHTKLILEDQHGYLYSITFSNLYNGRIPNKFHKLNPYTIHNIKLWCKLNNKQFKLISKEYIGNDKTLQWKCLIQECGEIFEMPWAQIYQNYGCGYCSGKKVSLSNCLATKNPELAKEWHPTKNGNLTPYDVTCGNDTLDIWWQCSKNSKHVWQSSIYNRKINKCPYCSGRYATEENNLFIAYPKLCEEWDYEKNEKRPEDYTPISGKKVHWKCKNCDYEWYTSIASRTHMNSGCPECNESKGEKEINNVLINNDWNKIPQEEFDQLINKYNKNYFIPQFKFDGLIGLKGGLLSYDFYLPNYNLLIEYQGEQHERYIPGMYKSIKDFERQVEHDKRKKEYAKNNNINLLEIWYYDFNNIESILQKELNLSEVMPNGIYSNFERRY